MVLINKLINLLGFRFVTFLFLLGWACQINAQVPELSFRYFSKEDGLVSANIFDIIQDESGYLWVGTINGINKFDGSTFHKYFYNPKDSLTPPSNYIRKFLVDSEGVLWIATASGLCTYNAEKDNFIRISEVGRMNGLPSNDFADLTEDKQGNIIVLVDNCIYRYNKQNTGFTKLFCVENDIGTSILTDEKNNLWLGTKNSGIVKYNLANKNLGYIQVKKGENSLSHNFVQDIEIWEDKLWVATMGDGINSMNLHTGEFIRYDVPTPDAVFCFKLFIDRKNNLWAMDYSGLKIYDRAKQDFHGYYPVENDPFSIKPAVKGIYQDNDNNYWIFNEPGGLALSVARFGFQFFSSNRNNYWYTSDSKITAIHEDKHGNLWLGNASTGVDVFNWKNGTVSSFLHDPNNSKSLGAGAIECIYRDLQNRIWVSTYHTGLQRYNEKENSFITYYHDASDSLSIAGRDIRSIREMRDGRMLLTIHGKGLDILNPVTGEFMHYTKEDNNLSNEWTFDAIEDSRGNIWVACSWGLSLLKKGEDVFRIFTNQPGDSSSLSDSYINCLYEDSGGYIWVGTINGLNRYNHSTNTFTDYSKKLESKYICSIQEDFEGNIWVSTLGGISKVSPKTKRVSNYTSSEGIRSGEFFPRSGYRDAEKHLYFGGSNGLEILKPKEIISKSNNQRIEINSLKLFNNEISYSSHPDILDKHISQTKELNLNYKQNFVTIGFGTLNFVNPDMDQYAYMLEGFDKDWIFVGKKREAVYTNLDPGDYKFVVRAMNSDHEWSKVPAFIYISITPPWYGTLFFKVVLVIFLVGFILLFTYLRTQQLHKQKIALRNTVHEKTNELQSKNEQLQAANTLLVDRQKTLEQQAKEIMAQSSKLEDNNTELQSLNATKDRLFSIIAHDLLSPFNAILGFSELMVKDFDELTDEEKLEDTKIINQSSVKVFGLLQNLLFWARSQTKGLKGYPELVDLNIIIEDTLSLQQEIILDKGITISTDLKAEVKAYADLEMIKTVARNLVSNAIKFSPPNDIITIKIYTDEVNNMAVFSVHDNGPGISNEIIDDMMNSKPITPGEGSLGEKGSGLGLTVCHEFVNANKGELHIESTGNSGSTFIVSLPLEA